PAADRPALVERFQTRTFEKNERLLVQDQPPPGLFLIASGEVAVVRHEGGDGEPLVLSTQTAGDVVGEVATVLRRKANADAFAVHPPVTLFLPVEGFMALIKDHPSILVELYRMAVKRDEETNIVMAEEAADAEDFVLV